MTHTPGPWEAHWTGSRWDIGNYGKTSHDVAYVRDACLLKGVDISVGEANARLIAAAPEMLEALQSTVACLERLMEKHEDFNNPYNNAALKGRAAIAKADGKS